MMREGRQLVNPTASNARRGNDELLPRLVDRERLKGVLPSGGYLLFGNSRGRRSSSVGPALGWRSGALVRCGPRFLDRIYSDDKPSHEVGQNEMNPEKRGRCMVRSALQHLAADRSSFRPRYPTLMQIIDFRVLAENIPHIVWAAGADGATTYFNQHGSDFTGLPPETNYGWGWVSLIHEEDAERAQDDWNLAQETRMPLDAQWRVRRADGEYRRMAIRGAPVFDTQGGSYSGWAHAPTLRTRSALKTISFGHNRPPPNRSRS